MNTPSAPLLSARRMLIHMLEQRVNALLALTILVLHCQVLVCCLMFESFLVNQHFAGAGSNTGKSFSKPSRANFLLFVSPNAQLNVRYNYIYFALKFPEENSREVLSKQVPLIIISLIFPDFMHIFWTKALLQILTNMTLLWQSLNIIFFFRYIR